MKINLIYSADTGNVLALFTHAAEPQQAESDPAAFVGDGLRIRGAGDPSAYNTLYGLTDFSDFSSAEFVVPAANLKLLEIDPDPATFGLIFKRIREQYVDSSSNVQPFSSGPLNISQTGTNPTFTVTLAAVPTSGNLVLLVQSVGAGDTQYVSKQLSVTGTANPVDLSNLGSGTYHVLVLVPGYPAQLLKVVVP